MSRLNFPILRTKLHRPPPAHDFVAREALLERLDASVRLPLTLVSAPAGYGKSTLVSHWLERSEMRSAWVSLDEGDDSLVEFLSYFVAGVRTLFEDSCEALASRLVDPEGTPPLKHLAAILSNDLDLIEQSFVLVFDDYHRLADSEIHDLVDLLLKHPPRGLHLVLLCRHDPPLALTSLRARHRMHEVRTADLQFTREESARFLGDVLEGIDEEAVAGLQQRTEGWPVALRLAALALRHGSRNVLLRERLGNSREFQDYLVSEVLAGQEPEMRDWLCKTSILDRFCAPLCDAVCTNGVSNPGGANFGGSRFLRALQDQGIPTVSLDEQWEWFRYHHLFQESLQQRLAQESRIELVATLHRHAADWLEDEGLIEEALRHLKAAGDASAIGRLIVRQRERISEEEHWHRLERWLTLAPPDLLRSDPEILLLRAWSAEHRERIEETGRLAAEAEVLVEGLPDEDPRKSCFRGEIAALNSRTLFIRGEAESTRLRAEEALRLLPPERVGERGFAKMMLVGALHRQGRGEEVLAFLHEDLGDEASQSVAFRGRILLALSCVHWLDGDLGDVLQTAPLLVKHSREHRLYETLHCGKFLLGAALYHRNRLDEAEQEAQADDLGGRIKYVAALALVRAFIDQARLRPDAAVESLEALQGRLLEGGHTVAVPYLRACRAELALRQGRSAEALQWAQTYKAEEFPIGLEVHWMETTAVKVFLHEGSAESLARAEEILDSMRRFLEKMHYRRFLIDAEALQALLHDRRGENEAAVAALGRAIRMAQPGRWIRLFVDLGPDVFKLLHRLEAEGDALRYVGEIQAAFQNEAATIEEAGEPGDPSGPVLTRSVLTKSAQPLIDPLTPRELEVLARLGERESNKEIAAVLGISSGTVKRHAKNIYEKLAVHSRDEAVEKAVALGILKIV